MKQLAHWVTDDSGKAALHRHSPILLSSLTCQCLPVYPDRVFIYPVPQHQGGPAQWSLDGPPVRALRMGASQSAHVQSQNSLSFHGTVEWAPALCAGTQSILCLRAKACSQVPHGSLGYCCVGVGGLWEAFVPETLWKAVLNSWVLGQPRGRGLERETHKDRTGPGVGPLQWHFMLFRSSPTLLLSWGSYGFSRAVASWHHPWWGDADWVDRWFRRVRSWERQAWSLFATIT